MRWQGRRGSSNVEDKRGLSSKGVIGGGIGGIVIILIVMLLGGDPNSLLQNIQVDQQTSSSNYSETAEEKQLVQFVSVVLAETEDTWHKIFSDLGENYREPKLVLFTESVQSACGTAGASTGPFYCPGDEKLYIDLSFYDELQKKI